MEHQISVLGTAADVVVQHVDEKVGWFRRKLVPRGFPYLEWTVDGVPLRQIVAWPTGEVAGEVTRLSDFERGDGLRSCCVSSCSGERDG